MDNLLYIFAVWMWVVIEFNTYRRAVGLEV